jgi:hypothetical protein
MALVVFMADRLAREENQRQALVLGSCQSADPATTAASADCLEHVQTRSNWFLQVWHGATERLPAAALWVG